jgi:ectoine hydroxylase-related dioxygenase (phytanoyl-CoA dioxygenase family)
VTALAPGSRVARTRVLSHRDLYLFDTQGLLLVPRLFGAEEVAELRATFETVEPSMWQDFSNAHRWNHVAKLHPRFAARACYRRLVDRAFDLINQPMRLLESYSVRYQPGGSHFMHAGAAQDTTYPDGTHATINLAVQSRYHDGRLYSTQVKTIVYLTDIDTVDEGAFCFIHGSHKANFAFPWAEAGLAADRTLSESSFPGLGTVLPKAGDVLLLNEALCHGATRTNRTRHIVSFLWGPAFMPDFERIVPRAGDLETVGYYDMDYERSGQGFVCGCEKAESCELPGGGAP